MALTIEELKSKLASEYDEVSLLEILDIKADDLVELFEDRIIDKQDLLRSQFEEDETDDNDSG